MGNHQRKVRAGKDSEAPVKPAYKDKKNEKNVYYNCTHCKGILHSGSYLRQSRMKCPHCEKKTDVIPQFKVNM